MGVKTAVGVGLFSFSFSSMGGIEIEKNFNIRRGREFCFIFGQTKTKKRIS